MNFPLKNAYYGGANDIKMGKTELSFLLSLTYLIFVIFFTQTRFLENKIYTEERVNYENGFRDKIA